MKTLVIVRHAKSSWDNPGLPDHERSLSKRGLRDAPKMGARLADWGPPVDRVISSSAVRALTTAELITQEMGLPWDEVVLQFAVEHWMEIGDEAAVTAEINTPKMHR
jgi:phosphohistidine phosphatase